MTGDVRSVLTDTLREALVSAHPFNGGKYPDWFREWIDEAVPKAVDAILGLSGVAVTQLPEPDNTADPQLYDVSFKGHSDDEYAKGARTPRVCIDTAVPELYTVAMPVTHISPDAARSFAAALLAASRVAEQHQDQT